MRLIYNFTRSSLINRLLPESSFLSNTLILIGSLAGDVRLETGNELTIAVEVVVEPGTFLNSSLISILTPTIISLWKKCYLTSLEIGKQSFVFSFFNDKLLKKISLSLRGISSGYLLCCTTYRI
jgi:hypothetical protein